VGAEQNFAVRGRPDRDLVDPKIFYDRQAAGSSNDSHSAVHIFGHAQFPICFDTGSHHFSGRLPGIDLAALLIHGEDVWEFCPRAARSAPSRPLSENVATRRPERDFISHTAGGLLVAS
jgi:hypothetical protein